MSHVFALVHTNIQKYTALARGFPLAKDLRFSFINDLDRITVRVRRRRKVRDDLPAVVRKIPVTGVRLQFVQQARSCTGWGIWSKVKGPVLT